MKLYKEKYFEVIFSLLCQEFIGQCIISGSNGLGGYWNIRNIQQEK